MWDKHLKSKISQLAFLLIYFNFKVYCVGFLFDILLWQSQGRTTFNFLQVRKEIYQIKQQQLHLAEDEYKHLRDMAAWSNTKYPAAGGGSAAGGISGGASGSITSCEWYISKLRLICWPLFLLSKLSYITFCVWLRARNVVLQVRNHQGPCIYQSSSRNLKSQAKNWCWLYC